MTKLRTAFLLGLAVHVTAFAVDPTLLRMVMPDAKVVAGLRVDHALNSVFGQFVVSHMQLDDPGFRKFMSETGFDPRRDLTEVLMASNWEQTAPESRWLVLGRGLFDLNKIARVAQANGAAVVNFQGVDILTYLADPKRDAHNGVAFFDSGTAVMGDVGSVKAAIARKQSNAAPDGKLLAKAQSLSARNDFWFTTLVPVSEFAEAMPDSNLSDALQGNLMQAIHEASGGVRFGDNVTISGEAVTRSDKDAAALVDVFRFLAGLLQMNRQHDKMTSELAHTLDGLDLKTAGNVMSMSLAIPERQLEQLLEGFRPGNREGGKKPQGN